MRDKHHQKPDECPNCGEHDVDSHLGIAWCNDCGYEWPVPLSNQQTLQSESEEVK